MVSGGKYGNRSEAGEQILNLVLAKIGERQAELVLR